MYGLNTADSDYDYVEVVYDRDDFVDPLREREYTKTHDELVVHSVAKFCKLLVKGNPNTLDLVNHKPLEGKDTFVTGLVNEVRPYALTRQVIGSYLGYMNQQYSRGMTSYNNKQLMHFFRLAFTLNGILATGEYHYLNEGEKGFLMTVRQGNITKEEIEAQAKNFMAGFDARKDIKLPFRGTEDLERAISGYFKDRV